MSRLTEHELELLRILRFEGGARIIRELASKCDYSALAGRGFVVETPLAEGNVHVILTEMGRRALESFIN